MDLVAILAGRQIMGKCGGDSIASSCHQRYTVIKQHEFTAIIEFDEGWVVACAPEIRGANGRGKTKEEALRRLSEAKLILLDRREDGLRGVPDSALKETATVV